MAFFAQQGQKQQTAVQKRGAAGRVMRRRILIDWEETWLRVRGFLMNIPALLGNAAEFSCCFPPEQFFKKNEIFYARCLVSLQNNSVNIFFPYLSLNNSATFQPKSTFFCTEHYFL